MCMCVHGSVLQLQDAIKSRCQIQQDKQVLLISGGENLDPSARVCSYSAGTVSQLLVLYVLNCTALKCHNYALFCMLQL